MATDYRNTEIPPSTSSFGTPGASLRVYELFTVRHCAGCRPNFLMPTPPSPSLPPLCNPQSCCQSFPALLQLPLVSLSSRIKPLLEMRLEALEHLFFYVFDVGELAPTRDIAVFRRALNFHDKFFHEPPLVPVFFPKMLACKCPPFVSAGSCFLIPYVAPNFCIGSLPPPIMLETFSCST
jgi:hypothetical protein